MFLPLTAEAQEKTKEKGTLAFNGINISTDLFGYVSSFLDDGMSGEVAIEANLGDRLFPTVEAGYGSIDIIDENFGIHYKSAAPYFRAGLNYNFSTTAENPNPDYSIFAIGRFAWTSGKYDIHTPPIIDPVWGGSTALDLVGVKGSAMWAEIGVGVRVKIVKNFHMGWTIRYKARISQEKASNSQMWYIPGYGINQSTCFGGTYNLIYEIPFK